MPDAARAGTAGGAGRRHRRRAPRRLRRAGPRGARRGRGPDPAGRAPDGAPARLPASALLRSHVESLGVEVHTECRVGGLRQLDGAVTAVELADGYVLDAQVVVLACGVRPRVSLARSAGLSVATGIVIDDALRTSDPFIHAIGDCAEHAGQVYGLAGPALEQADVLADLLLAETAAGAGGDSAVPSGDSAVAGGDSAVASGPAPREAATASGPGGAPPLWAIVPLGGTGGHTDGALSGASAFRAPARTTGDGAPGVRVQALKPLAPAGRGSVVPTRSAPAERLPTTRAAGTGTAPAERPSDTGAQPAPAPRYTGTRALTRLTLGGPRPLDLAAFGRVAPEAGDEVVQLTDATRAAYRKVVVRGDRLVGGVLLGDLAAVGALARAWEGDEALSEEAPLIHLLTHDGGST
ncbi:FAD-dependent oxidoreductase [Streptomyces diastatochromogenes]|nr:FAD-dependent oxidoreductase [Streptomyces diastatochromogenes]